MEVDNDDEEELSLPKFQLIAAAIEFFGETFRRNEFPREAVCNFVIYSMNAKLRH